MSRQAAVATPTGYNEALDESPVDELPIGVKEKAPIADPASKVNIIKTAVTIAAMFDIPKKRVPPSAIASWRGKYLDKWVLAWGAEVVAWGDTAHEAWKRAKPYLRQHNLKKSELTQIRL